MAHMSDPSIFISSFVFVLVVLLFACGLFLRHDLKLAVSEMLLHIELQASHLENRVHTFVNLV